MEMDVLSHGRAMCEAPGLFYGGLEVRIFGAGPEYAVCEYAIWPWPSRLRFSHRDRVKELQ
jgi:hypothetical protein